MAGYFDYQGVNSGHLEAGPSSFVRPLNLDRKSGGTYNSRGSGASGLTYATNGSAPIPDENRQEPVEPIMGVPTPVMPSKSLHLRGEERYDDEEEEEEEEDEDPEYMMVDADLSMVSQFGAQNQPPSYAFQEPPPKVMNNKPVPVKVQGGRKGFVGGFVSGLRSLPRLLRNQRGKTVQRQSSHDTVLELPGFGEDSPGYDPFRAQPPTITQPPSSMLHRPPHIQHPIPSIPASHQVTSMHYSHYTHDEQTEPTERSETPNSRDPNDFDSEELDHGHHSGSDEEEAEEEEDQQSTHKGSTVGHSGHQQTRFSHHSTHHSNHPSNQDSGGRKSNHHSRNPSPHPSHTPSHPPTALDGDTTLVHRTQNDEPEAVVVHPLPTSDYKSMAPESAPSPSPSVVANSNRIHKFMSDIYNLPWVSTQVTVDFIPDRDGRRYEGMDPDAKRMPKPPQSWYPSLNKDIDLLAYDTQPQSAPVMAHRRQDGHRRALTESTVTPTSGAVTQSVTPSTTYSPRRYSVNSEPIPRHSRHTRDFRHSQRHRRRHRDHSRPHSPPVYPVIASPQPMYFVPGPGSPPMMPIPHPQPVVGSSASPSRSRKGITAPVPVYVIPMPPPVYQPMAGFSYASPPPTQVQAAPPQPALSQPASIPPTSA